MIPSESLDERAFHSETSAFDRFAERVDNFATSGTGHQYLATDDDSTLDSSAGAADSSGAADSFISFGDVPSVATSPHISSAAAATGGSTSLVPPDQPAVPESRHDAYVCGPQSGGLMPFPPAGLVGSTTGLSPSAISCGKAESKVPPCSVPTSSPSDVGRANAAVKSGRKWPCGPLRCLDSNSDLSASAANTCSIAGPLGVTVPGASGASISPSFQLQSPSPLISSQTLATWGAVEESTVLVHTPALARRQSMGLPSPSCSDWLTIGVGASRAPGVWELSGTGSSSGGFSLGPPAEIPADRVPSSSSGLEGLWGAVSGRERHTEAGAASGLASLAQTPSVQTPGGGLEGFWSGLLTPSATSPHSASPHFAPAACGGVPSPRLSGGPPPPPGKAAGAGSASAVGACMQPASAPAACMMGSAEGIISAAAGPDAPGTVPSQR